MGSADELEEQTAPFWFKYYKLIKMLASGFSLQTHCIIRFISVPFFLLFLSARSHTVSKPWNKLEKQAFYLALSHLIILERCKRVDQYSSGFLFQI